MLKTLEELVIHLQALRSSHYIGCTSLPGDPLHSGHLDCLAAGVTRTRQIAWIAEKEPLVVVLVNGNSFLERKKGFYFMDGEERRRLIGAVKGIDHAVLWDSPTNSQMVHEAIRLLRPDFFWKGGDVTPERFPEEERRACEDVGCRLEFNVGGGKGNSSTDIVGSFLDRVSNRRIVIGPNDYWIES